MRFDLYDKQRPEHVGQGKFTGADGSGYSPRGTRAKRAVCAELIDAGAPVVIEHQAHAISEWFDGDDARSVWSDVSHHVLSRQPTTKELLDHERFTAGVWESDEGKPLLYLTEHC